MRTSLPRHWWFRYGMAVLLLAAATAIRAALTPLIGYHLAYPLYFIAVLLAARYLGTGPSLLAAFAGAVISLDLFAAPISSLRTAELDLVGWIFYVLAAVTGLLLVRARSGAISARKRTEAELLEALQRLKLHVENSPAGAIEWDAEFRVARWTGGAERIFGWKAEEVLGRRIGELRLVSQENEPAFAQLMAEMRRGEQPRNLHASRNRRKDGAEIYCEWYNSALVASDGKLVSVLSLVLDISERRRVEEQLRRAQRLESLGVLAGGVAHDFNNLLTGVLGNASLALEDLPPAHPCRAQVEAILEASESAARLTQQLLAYAGMGRIVIEPLDLSEIVRQTAALIRSSIPSNVEVRLDLAPGLPALQADRSQMQQLVMNLMLNATEAIEKARPGVVRVRTACRRVSGGDAWRSFEGQQPEPGD